MAAIAVPSAQRASRACTEEEETLLTLYRQLEASSSGSIVQKPIPKPTTNAPPLSVLSAKEAVDKLQAMKAKSGATSEV